ncbi:hypothetical protein C2845_PM07G19550 [Panicum miliaceum]|uniref:Uncharacterized protein n=1 Tax=Panicum miliaceum TaxID=4540 RepID=A0A3L6SKJ4_PANMI|nr:hypothetical protein C2845_PM07G19550 [Panicum miliaceum]
MSHDFLIFILLVCSLPHLPHPHLPHAGSHLPHGRSPPIAAEAGGQSSSAPRSSLIAAAGRSSSDPRRSLAGSCAAAPELRLLAVADQPVELRPAPPLLAAGGRAPPARGGGPAAEIQPRGLVRGGGHAGDLAPIVESAAPTAPPSSCSARWDPLYVKARASGSR